MNERKPYPVRKNSRQALGFKAWFIVLRSEAEYQKFVTTLELPPTEQAFLFKTTSTSIHNWRRWHKEETA